MDSFKLLALLGLCYLTACTKYIDYKKNDNQEILSDIDLKIESYQTIPVILGITSSPVTKGFWVNLTFNPLQEADILKLLKTKSIDSWLVLVKRIDSDRNQQTVGLITVPLMSGDHPRLLDKFKFYIYYDATLYRKSTEKCPPVGHKKFISQSELKMRDLGSESKYGIIGTDAKKSGNREINQEISIFQLSSFPSNEPITLAGYEKTRISAGDSLIGDYQISMGLYNSTMRIIYGRPVEAKELIQIIEEKEINLQNCR